MVDLHPDVKEEPPLLTGLLRQAHDGKWWISLGGKPVMVPVGIGLWGRADPIQPEDFLRSELPLRRAQVITQLSFIPGSDQNRGYAWFTDHPIKSHLRSREISSSTSTMR